MLRYSADYKTLLYLLATTALMFSLYLFHDSYGELTWFTLYISELFLAISVGVIVHNHRHVPIWKNHKINTATDLWLTFLYGFPVFGWIPTHLQNHHTHTNKEPDYTKTYAYSEKNNLWTLLYYPMHSSNVQLKAIRNYMGVLRKKNRATFRQHVMQIVFIIGVMVIALVIDWKATLIYIVIPQQIALNGVLFFNYIQHIHADEQSEYNHSRNIEGLLNTLLFNNGLHTAHHLKPHLHWSRLPEYHIEIRDKISPQLIEKNLTWFLIRQYILSPFKKSWSTKSMRAISQEQ